MTSISLDQVECVLVFLGLRFPRSGLASDKAQILFQSCRPGYRAQSVLRERRGGLRSVCWWCVVSYMGFLDPTWLLVKLKTFSKEVGLYNASSGGGIVCGYWIGLKRLSVSVNDVLPGILRSSLAFCKAVRTMGPIMEPR